MISYCVNLKGWLKKKHVIMCLLPWLRSKGLLANWYEILVPLSSRETAIQRYRIAIQDGPEKSDGEDDGLADEKLLKPKAI